MYFLTSKDETDNIAMSTKTNELLKVFEANKGILRFSRILEEGFHRKQMRVLLEGGMIRRMGRGL